MRRIAVIGNGGGGKSTLSRALGERLGIPVHEVDIVQWRTGWERAPLDETATILNGWVAEEAWIIDGFGPLPVLDRRFDRADTIVHVDHGFSQHLWWAAKREVATRLRGTSWGGRRLPPKSVLLAKTLRRVHAMRPQLLEMTSRGDRAGKLVHLRSPAEMRRWLDSVEAPVRRSS